MVAGFFYRHCATYLSSRLPEFPLLLGFKTIKLPSTLKRHSMQFWKKVAATTALGVVLTACGGGDSLGGDEAGTGPDRSAARFAPNNNNCAGGDIDASLNYRPPTFATVGESMRLVPVVGGIPDACRPFLRFSLGGTGGIPGMVLDTATGVFSGSPTKGGYFLKTLRLTISGFTGYVDANATFLIEDPAQHSFLR